MGCKLKSRFHSFSIRIIIRLCKAFCIFIVISALLSPLDISACSAVDFQKIGHLIGDNDSILIADANDHILYSKNEKKLLIPASSLKIFTALTAIHYLKEDFRFHTDFYIDHASDLTIKGYGDPLMISENVKEIAENLSHHISCINNIYLDDSYFVQPIIIPGVTHNTSDPYNAPNGAFCVNFNTINFTWRNNRYLSAEPQTPLLPMATKLAQKSGLKSGRIAIFNNENQITYYAGQMFAFFLKNKGIQINGNLLLSQVDKEKHRLLYRYTSPFKLTDVIAKLLAYSNNYIANQVFLTVGADQFGSPATVEKGIKAAEIYAKTNLKLGDINIVEGSGISRRNKISALSFLKILEEFSPYYTLLRRQGNEYYKTGTLNGIRTRAGYIQTEKKGLCRYVVMLNTPGKTCDQVMAKIRKCLD